MIVDFSSISFNSSQNLSFNLLNGNNSIFTLLQECTKASIYKLYAVSNLGYGGNGNVFLFKANNKLLLNSLPTYNWNQTWQSAIIMN